MNPRIKHIMVAIAAIMILCGCEDNCEQAPQVGQPKTFRGAYYIDTISIHGNEHEIVRDNVSHQGGMMHSPECWCGKGGGR